MPATIPVMGGKLKFKVFDEDTLSDELIGSFELNAKDILGDRNGDFFWENIYGAPKGTSGHAADDMNETPAHASFWKGRILMQVEAVKTDKPFLRMENIKGTDKGDDSSSSDGDHHDEDDKGAKAQEQLEREHE